MTVTETCACGAKVIVTFSHNTSEHALAEKQLRSFRTRHPHYCGAKKR